MNQQSIKDWRDEFLQQLQEPDHAAPLKKASLEENLKDWTRLTTDSVVRTCESLGLECAARGHRSNRLPESASEYLALDTMAFPRRDADEKRWPMPLAVFELENSPRNDRVGYSLWKVLCVRAPLRVVYAYRRDWEQTRELIEHLAENVIGSLSPDERTEIGGETVIVTGSRGESETFPYGYFKFWLLDTNLGQFERM